MVIDYFSLDKLEFIQRYFPGRKGMLERATSQDSYRQIVERLANRNQINVVAASEDTNLLIVAGPGSGKTRVVVHRCAWLIRVKRIRPENILVLCFNRSAAITLRTRARALLNDDARALTILTYHSLAMRLTGTTFVELSKKHADNQLTFDGILQEAVSFLQGGLEIPGLGRDDLRDRLLAGYSHILVDEYQDIDHLQYALISALAGRTEKEPDRKLTILAVGDDDQNIYAFRGANVQFIRRFKEDYNATLHCLTENYRSTAHIIEAANEFIQHNQDRMKTESPIVVNKARKKEPPGGRWTHLDPVTSGRVQIVSVTGKGHQAAALIEQVERLRACDQKLLWQDCAVLARTRADLFAVRTLCESLGIPFVWSLEREKIPPFHKVREIALFLDALKMEKDNLVTVPRLKDILAKLNDYQNNPWWALVNDILNELAEEFSNNEIPAEYAVTYFYDALALQRREHHLGNGLFLSTVHGVKGMEFDHVFILDGSWLPGKTQKAQEEERRIFYVAMTRARETMCIFEQQTANNPHLPLLQGDFIVRLPGAVHIPEDIEQIRYELLGLDDLFLSFAGHKPVTHPVHRHLAALKPGSILFPESHNDRIKLMDETGFCVAMLSKSACNGWNKKSDKIKSIRVRAMIRRDRDSSEDSFRKTCLSNQWEVPLVEILYRGD